ncbi:hypothetical protein PPYR_03898 [Photinus pyralis]|uniref:F-box domain-containing protein n=1 Tax=Photinus pyralis TaxID=7054 RepID=A0A5N4AWH4_PHOPY|nr:F-box/WD repeat-containing protein 4 [Photinus pyralis]KAB0801712.1 hypothetical protein PPYR_03898 [Photinus pyralis]
MNQITHLSTEVLIKIFEYCPISTLGVLQRTCKRFYKIIQKATTLGNVTPILSTNQLHSEMRNRCNKFFDLKHKYRISRNWMNGIYQECILAKDKKRYIPYLVLQKDRLWLSKANRIHLYKRNRRGMSYSTFIAMQSKSDICKFAIQKNCLVSGQRDGSVFISNLKSDRLHLENCHRLDIEAINFVDDFFVTGSKDTYVKLWPLKQELQHPYVPISSVSVGDRIWSSATSSKNSLLVIGTGGHNGVAPIQILDLSRFTVISELGKDFPIGAGVLGLKWEDPHTLLSCGYDKSIRNWDMRSGQCVQVWTDPFNATIYCFETDNCCTLVAGTQTNGRVVLWDMRTVRYVQMYFMEVCKTSFKSSPIYSLSFDAFELFAASDCNLTVLDFSVHSGIEKNYNMYGM